MNQAADGRSGLLLMLRCIHHPPFSSTSQTMSLHRRERRVTFTTPPKIMQAAVGIFVISFPCTGPSLIMFTTGDTNTDIRLHMHVVRSLGMALALSLRFSPACRAGLRCSCENQPHGFISPRCGRVDCLQDHNIRL